LVLIFFDGSRFRIEGPAEIVVESGGLAADGAGEDAIRELETVPAIARLAPIARSERPGRLAGASRIRDGGSLEAELELEPRGGERVSSEGAVLRWTPVEGAEAYRIAVSDEAGREVFSAQGRESRQPLPSGVLEPGELYYWQVSSSADCHHTLHGGALFATLEREEDEARRELEARVLEGVEGDLLVFLTEVESRLDGRAEACRRLLELEGRGPSPGELAEIALRFGCGELPAKRRDQALESAEFLVRIGELELEAGRLDPAAEHLARALVQTEAVGPGTETHARALHQLGLLAWWRGDLGRAEERLGEALAIFQRSGEEGLDLAGVLSGLGILARGRGDLERSESLLHRSLEIRERLDPGSLAVAASLNNLGVIAEARGDLAASRDLHLRALALRERLAPGSKDHATSLINLGVLAKERGELAEAEAFYRASLEIYRRVAPGSAEEAASLNNLGLVAEQRGDWARAEAYLLQALEVREDGGLGGRESAILLGNLGLVARSRGDLEAAESYLERALARFEKLAPGSLELATALADLGGVAQLRGELETARGHLLRALEIRQARAPGSVDAVRSLDALGRLALETGDLARAETRFARARDLLLDLASEGVDLASVLEGSSEVALRRGELSAARDLAERTLELRRALAPGSLALARAHARLARLDHHEGRSAARLEHLRLASESLGAQSWRLGGPYEVRADFAAANARHDGAYLEALLEAGSGAEAFAVVERSRARGFLRLLAERDLVLSTVLPEDLDRERRRVRFAHDRVLDRLAELDADGEEARALRARLEELRLERREIQARIRAAAPRLADLVDPRPLELGDVQGVLEPGTLLLAFHIGEERSQLFAVSRGAFEVFDLGLGRSELAGAVERLRTFLRENRDAQVFERQAASLSALLLGPAAEPISGAERLAIAPDGPLYALPFGALADPNRPGRYLIEGRPLFLVSSVTVSSRLGDRHPSERPPRLIAFGDPAYPASEPSEAMLRGFDLRPLPATRPELAALAEVFPGPSSLFLGEEATEERVGELANEATHLHFASHGLVDEQFPLDSALALAIPEKGEHRRENGLLQAWEIFERLSLDAELVTLSACSTGLGREYAGEGLLGLVRAFQYAGARAVVASLWPVEDESTAELMAAFYGHLGSSRAQAEALRRAQVAMIEAGGAVAHPYHWAGFQLWR